MLWTRWMAPDGRACAAGHWRGPGRRGWERWAGVGAAVKDGPPGSGGVADGRIRGAVDGRGAPGAVLGRGLAGEQAGQRPEGGVSPRRDLTRRAREDAIAAGAGHRAPGLGSGRLGAGWTGWRHRSRRGLRVATLPP